MSRRLFKGSTGLPLAWTNLYAECGNISPSKKVWARSVSVDVAKEKQDGIEGDWQQESPHKEELDLVKHSSDRTRAEDSLSSWTNAHDEAIVAMQRAVVYSHRKPSKSHSLATARDDNENMEGMHREQRCR